MIISIISAIAKNLAIGKGNKLLYSLPDDMKRFKELTTGHTVIMGRNTFISLPKRPLPNRRNIVLALPNEVPEDKEGTEWVNSIDEALQLCKDDGEVFIIGGAFVYQQFLPIADRLYLTFVEDKPEDADAFFPAIDFPHWVEKYREDHPADNKHEKAFSFVNFERDELFTRIYNPNKNS